MIEPRERFPLLQLALAALMAALPLSAIAGESVGDALKEGAVNVDARYRYEIVDEDGFTEDAKASTLRLRIGYRTGKYHDFLAHVELEDLRVIGAEQYDSTANGLGTFPAVYDPEDTELNQGYLGFTPTEELTFKLGRQRVVLDNHRFIGNVGWRQLEQTFDAFTANLAFTEKLTVTAAYLINANRIFGENHPTAAKADTDLSAPLLNVSYEFPAGKLAGYAYLIELDDSPTQSHRDLGLRYHGHHEITDDVSVNYTAEFAHQSDYKDGASSIDATYTLAEMGVDIKKVNLKVGYELLAGDGTYAFQTPLATLHAFNGWTDKFLATPDTGLEDTYLSVGGTVKGIKLLAVYHDFSADEGGADYGSEVGLLATKTFKKMYSVGLKYAEFDTDDPLSYDDTRKTWAWLQLKF